jgi:hypothetical protein
MAQDSGEVEQIKAEIEETRAGMSETIDEIQDRLKPANLARQAGESIKDATVARARDLADRASSVAGDFRERPADVGMATMRALSENPVVAAVIGIMATAMGVRAFRSGRKGTGYLMGAAAGMAGWSLWHAYERSASGDYRAAPHGQPEVRTQV